MKYEYKKPENEVLISFKYIILQCIKNIPIVLCMMVIFAILLPTLMFFKDYKSYNDAQNKPAADEIVLTVREQASVDNYVLMVERLESLEERLEESIYLNLNPSNFYEVRMQYKVVAEQDTRNELVELFTDYVNTSLLATEISQEKGYSETKHLREIIKATSQLEIGEESSGVFNIRIWSLDSEQGQFLSNAIVDAITKYDTQLQNEIGNHKLVLLRSEGEYRWADEIYTALSTIQKEKKELILGIDNYEVEFTNSQRAVADFLLGKGEEKEDSVVNEVQKPTFDTKFLVLGGAIGIVFAGAWIVLSALFGGKIQTDKELYERFGIAHLSTIKCRSNTAIGKLLDRIIFSKTVNEINNRIELLASQLKYYSKDKIVLMSSVVSQEEKVLNELAENLKEKGVDCKVINVADGSKAFEYIAENKKVVLVEVLGVSVIKNVYEQYERCCLMDVDIIGYISINK